MKHQVFVSAATDELKSLPAGCLHELFENQVLKTPQLPALISEQESLSYLELEAKANQYARFLRAQGISRGSLVGIYFDKGPGAIVAILGALKAGAGYVPIDPSFPSERIKYILEETTAAALLTEDSLLEKAKQYFEGKCLSYDAISWKDFSKEALPKDALSAQPEDLCYLIYTSGTTGKPKGVMAEHRNAYLYTLAFNKVCGTDTTDKIFQGFSLSFDGSIEEIWMAYSNGSALVVASKDTPKFGAELGQFLGKMGVTYFSTVPTLLSTIPDAIPSLRILIVSGEVCPMELVNRWAVGDVKMWNVYGPTEATVNTSAFLCKPGKTITIGHPLPGYDIHILNENFKPVAYGEKGELFVGGRTLARGYYAREDLTSKQFLTLAELDGKKNVRVYRTGDSVRWNEAGEIEFYGRIDSQVKIRGYRVELSEIEAILLEQSNISTAAVKLVEQDGLQELAAYVILKNPSLQLDRNQLLNALDARVPPYMVPGYLEVLAEFPMLASGKVDRKSLPKPAHPFVRERSEIIEATTPMEVKLEVLWSEVFSLPRVSVTDNFFLDLGGHSLMAAKLATKIRERILGTFGIKDIYSQPTIRELANYLEIASLRSQKPKHTERPKTSEENFQTFSKFTYPWVAAAQALGVYLLQTVTVAPLAIFLICQVLWANDVITGATLWKIILAVAILRSPVVLLTSLAAKWILIGRYKAGSYPLWRGYYLRWWFVNRLQVLANADILAGTPLMNLYYRAMGAKVGNNVIIDTAQASAWDLISIGDNSSIGYETQLLGYRVENGMLHLGPVTIGKDAFVGIHSTLGLNTKMEDHSFLDDQSMLPDSSLIRKGEGFKGSPAKKASVHVPKVEMPVKRYPLFFGFIHMIQIMLIDACLLVPTAGISALIAYTQFTFGLQYAIATTLAAVPLGFIAYALYIVALKRLVLNKAKPGIYSTESVFYLRKWFADRLIKHSKLLLLPLYTTIFFPHWLRLLGAKIGARAEISVLGYYSPELIEMGEESFFADSSIIGGKKFYRGHFEIAKNIIGKRSFVGNGSFLPVGANIGENCLLGVQSCPATLQTPDGTDWLGSPAFRLPHRDKVGGFSSEEIFRPGWKKILLRCFVDANRVFIPGFIFLSAFLIGAEFMGAIYNEVTTLGLIALIPFMGLGLSAYSIFVVCALKWTLLGKFKPVIKPLWSPYVWVNEMLNGIYEAVMAPALVPVMGTPFAAPLMGLIGCELGKRSYFESSLFSEFDMVHVGEYASINRGAMLQNHLFEDRIMKSSHAFVEKNANVGNMAIVLYDARMKEGSTIGPLSLLMKGETMEKDSNWHGIPTVEMENAGPFAQPWASPAAPQLVHPLRKPSPEMEQAIPHGPASTEQPQLENRE